MVFAPDCGIHPLSKIVNVTDFTTSVKEGNVVGVKRSWEKEGGSVVEE